MNNDLQSRVFKRVDEDDPIASLPEILDRKYSELIHAARRHWEKNFAGKDPTDSCVNVRVSDDTIAASDPRPRRAIGCQRLTKGHGQAWRVRLTKTSS